MVATYLAYRTLYSLCFPRHPCPNTAEKEELLLLLEKDIATLYFCHYCVKLHRWHTHWGRNWDNRIFPGVKEDLPCKRQLSRDFILLPYTCYIPYHHARLVMNRHFYGPTHGLPLHKFEERIRTYCRSSRVMESESLHVRIVDDKLMVLSVKTMSHSRGDSKTLRGCIESSGSPACKHLTLSRGHRDYSRVQLPELAKDKTAPGYFEPCDQSFRSCSFCLTDYCIDISWRGQSKGYIVKVSVYHQLGDCRSPFDWSWRSMATPRTVDGPRTAYPLEYRPGIVRDGWNKADGIDGRTQAEWVEVPELPELAC